MTGFDGLMPTVMPRPRLLGEGLTPEVEVRSEGSSSFGATLQRAVRDVADLQRDSHEKAMALVRGEPVQVHDVLVAMGKSEVAFNLALEVRNRLLQAWETLTRSVL